MTTSEVISALQNADSTGELEVNFLQADGTYTPVKPNDISVETDASESTIMVLNVNHPTTLPPTLG